MGAAQHKSHTSRDEADRILYERLRKFLSEEEVRSVQQEASDQMRGSRTRDAEDAELTDSVSLGAREAIPH